MQFVLAGAGLILQAAILGVMVKHRLRASFPGFFYYTGFGIFMLCVLTGAARVLGRTQYFYLYWILVAIELCLSLVVLHEVFANLLKPYSAVVDLGKMLFRWVALFLVFASTVTAAFTSSTPASRLTTTICLAQRSIQLMQCGLLLLLILFEKRLGLSWRSHGMCIALGIGTYAAADLVISRLQTGFPAWQSSLDILSNLFSLAVLLFWTIGLAIREPSRASAQDSPQRLVLERWNEALLASPLTGQETNPTPASVDSFLPGIERTVDKVLARKIVNS
jgi:hypothetical protein